MTNAALQDTDDKDWRRKYADVVRTLEADERRHRESEQTLKRLIGKLCLAGSGQSETLDAALQRLKELVAQEPLPGSELHGVGNVIASAVVEQERRRTGDAPAASIRPSAVPEMDGASAAANVDPAVRDALSRLLAELRRDPELTAAVERLGADLAGAVASSEMASLVQRAGALAAQRIRTLETLRSGLETLLDQMVGRLDEMSAWIAGDAAARREENSRRDDFGRQMQSEVSALGASADAANDLEQLRAVLRVRLDTFSRRLEEFRQREDAHQRAALAQSEKMHARITELESETDTLQRKIQEEKRIALLDPLTQVANRLGWERRSADELERWRQYPQPTCIATWDIDHFKRINDTFGHPAGDKALRLVAQCLAKQLRGSDFIARYGGEEFVMLLPGTPLESAMALCNRMREAVARIGFHFSGSPLVITVSCGITELRANDDTGIAFERADRALYRAKQEGRNRVLSEC